MTNSVEDRHTVALVPARGGSRRIPRKNVRPFCGIPMIERTLNALQESDCFTSIVVSTDDDEIAALASAHGVEVPFRRPAHLSDDVASTADVVLHALDWLSAERRMPRRLCVAYATAPFLDPQSVVEGHDLMVATGCASVFAATTFPYPIFRALRRGDDARVSMFWPEHRDTRSQDLPEAWHDAGQFYWIDCERFRSEPVFFGDDSRMVRLPRHRVQDIDTPEDWEQAEAMFRALGLDAGDQRIARP